MTLTEVLLGRAGMPEDNMRRLTVSLGMAVLGFVYGVLGNDFIGGTAMMTCIGSGAVQALLTALNPPGPGSKYR